MKVFSKLTIIFVVLSVSQIFAYKEIIGILDEAKDLTPEEKNALRPLFNDLQSQYDHIIIESTKIDESAKKTDDEYDAIYESVRHDFEDHFHSLFSEIKQQPNEKKYEIALPTLDDIVTNTKNTDSSMLTPEQQAEMIDLQTMIEDVLGEAEVNVNQMVKHALQIEANLLKLNKPKILGYIYKGLTILFRVSVRISRAAYCTYSHIPQLNVSLHNLYDGVDCYAYTKKLLARVEGEVIHTVGVIRHNLSDLAKVYHKINAKKTLLGKIATLILDLTRISSDLRETYAVGTNALNALENQLPNAAQESLNCATDFVATLPQMLETVSNVTTCILFVDDYKEDYEFLKPLAERNFH